MTDTLYVYRWNRCDRKGQLCKVIVRGSLNSCLVEFIDGLHGNKPKRYHES
jgi:hypothetical protein